MNTRIDIFHLRKEVYRKNMMDGHEEICRIADEFREKFGHDSSPVYHVLICSTPLEHEPTDDPAEVQFIYEALRTLLSELPPEEQSQDNDA